MVMSLPLQISAAVAGLALYLVLSLLYYRRWDASIRQWLGRRLGTEVRWSKVDASTGLFEGEGNVPALAWSSSSERPLHRQALDAVAIRTTQIVTMVGLGVLPAIAVLGAQILLRFHALLVLGSAIAVIAIFSLYWVGTYRR